MRVPVCRMIWGMRPHGEVDLGKTSLAHWGGAMRNSLRCSGKLSKQQLQVWASAPAVEPLKHVVPRCSSAIQQMSPN